MGWGRRGKARSSPGYRRLAGGCGLLLALALVTVIAAPSALAVPQMPHQLYGTVTFSGSPASAGVAVSARIGGQVFASTVTDASGRYGYSPTFKVPADDPDTPTKEGGVAGDIIGVLVADSLATTVPFQIGGSTNRDLTLSTAPTPTPTPAPAATTAPTPIPATRGLGGTTQPSATATPVPTAVPTAAPTAVPTVRPDSQVTPVPTTTGSTATIVSATRETRLELADKTTIQVPPAALPEFTQVRARSIAAAQVPSPPAGQVRKAVEIEVFDSRGEALGPTALTRAITIVVPLSQDDMDAIGGNPNNAELHRWDPDTKAWVRLAAEVDLVARTIRAQLRHLSLFVVVVPKPSAQATPTPAPTAKPAPMPTSTATLPTGGALPRGSSLLLVALAGIGVLLAGAHLLRRES